MKQATYEQGHEHVAQYSGATIRYRAGIDLTVSWEPKHAAVSVGYSHAAELGAIGHSRISIEWDQEENQ